MNDLINEDELGITKKKRDGHWHGTHWILKSGYCKACDANPCELDLKDNDYNAH